MIALGAILALLAAEGVGSYALAELLSSGGGGTAGWWAFAGIAFAGYAAPRLAEAFGIDARRREVAVTLLAVALIYACLRIAFAGDLAVWDLGWVSAFVRASGGDPAKAFRMGVAAVLLGLTWIRSARRSVDGVERELMPRQLGFELAIVTAVVLIGVTGDRAGEVARAGAAFYGLAVVALACSQLSLSGAAIDDREAGSIVSVLLIGTLATVIAGLLVIGIFFAWAGPLLGPPIGAVINAVMIAVLTPFAYAATWFAHLFVGSGAEWPQMNVPSAIDPGREQQQANGGHSAAAQFAIYALRALLLAAVVGGAYALVRWFTRVRDRLREADTDGPTDAASGGLRDDFAGILRAVFHRESHRPSATAGPAVRLYLDVVEASGRRGYPREPSRTPAEFAPELATAFQSPVTDEITRAFEQARYAGREPSAETIAALEHRWREMR